VCAAGTYTEETSAASCDECASGKYLTDNGEAETGEETAHFFFSPLLTHLNNTIHRSSRPRVRLLDMHRGNVRFH
jgi:hypothetical protein